MKLHLVDGTYELFRAHFGAPSATSPNGQPVGAVRGLMRSLLALLREPNVTHVAIAFDHVIESFRNDLFAGYKTGQGLDAQLLSQFPLAESTSRALGLVVWPMIPFEADDALATGAARYLQDPRVEQIVLCSPDKDLAQCVLDNTIICLDRMRKKTMNAEDVRAKFGVDPSSIPDYLALVGDSADGIPGVPRWGAKSASTVLGHYKHLSQIPDDDQDWQVRVRGANTLAQMLRQHRPQADLYRVLATLRTDVPLQEQVDDLEWTGADKKLLQDLCHLIGNEAILERIPRWR